MKKLLILALTAAMLITAVSCGSSKNEVPKSVISHVENAVNEKYGIKVKVIQADPTRPTSGRASTSLSRTRSTRDTVSR